MDTVEKLKNATAKIGLSYEQLGAYLGVTKQTIQFWFERGGPYKPRRAETRERVDQLLKLALQYSSAPSVARDKILAIEALETYHRPRIRESTREARIAQQQRVLAAAQAANWTMDELAEHFDTDYKQVEAWISGKHAMLDSAKVAKLYEMEESYCSPQPAQRPEPASAQPTTLRSPFFYWSLGAITGLTIAGVIATLAAFVLVL